MNRTAAICLPGVGYRTAVFARAVTRLVDKLESWNINVASFLTSSGGALMGVKYAQAANQKEIRPYCKAVETDWEKVGEHGPQKIIPLDKSDIANAFNSRIPLTQIPMPVIAKSTILRHILAPYHVPSDTLYALLNGTMFGTPSVDAKKVIESPIHLDIFVESTRIDPDTHVIRKTLNVISNRDKLVQNNPQNIVDAAVASACLPGVFPKIEIGDAYHSDCGIIDPWIAVKRGYDYIIELTAEFQTVWDPDAMDRFAKSSYEAALFQLQGSYSTTKGIICDNFYREAEEKLQARETGKLEKTASWIGQKEQKIHRIFLGGDTSTLHVHTFKKDDISWAIELGDKQMEAELQKLEERGFFG